ncbi:MAG: hypothetical protein HY747_01690 [Elusimicrobia bacterium]|nr:hypothetical protein [Elusimicrobiota bacterium]
MKKKAAIGFILLSINNFCGKLSAQCPDLINTTPIVEQYASGITAGFENNFSLEDKLKYIVHFIHGEKGVGSGKLAPSTFFALHGVFQGKKIRNVDEMLSRGRNIPALSNMDRGALQSHLALYNKYAKTNPKKIFFAPTASDIIEHKMAFGCSHYARTFIAIVKALKLLAPKDIRYVVSASHKDYDTACPRKKTAYNKEMTINGHQFVMIRLDGHWWFLNTSNADFEKVPAQNTDYKSTNLAVQFPSYKNNHDSGHDYLLVRYIGNDYNDGACDNSLENLANISVSGNKNANKCEWTRYELAKAPQD